MEATTPHSFDSPEDHKLSMRASLSNTHHLYSFTKDFTYLILRMLRSAITCLPSWDINRYCILACCFSMTMPAQADIDIDKMLEQAHQSRTSNPLASREIIKTLKEYRNQLSPSQYDELQFIDAYSTAFQGQVTQAINIALGIKNSPFKTTALKANLLLANIYNGTHHYTAAFEHLYMTLELVEAINDPELLANTYTVAAQLHNNAAAYDIAIEYADNIKSVSSHPRFRCIADELRISAIAAQGHTLSPGLVSQGVSSCRDAKEPLIANTILLSQATVMLDSSPEYVNSVMTKALRELDNINFPGATCRANYFKGAALLKMGQLTQALPMLQKAHQQATEIADQVTIRDTVFQLAKLHEQLGQVEQSLYWYKKYVSTTQTTDRDKNARILAYQLARFNLQASQQQIAMLNKENELLTSEAKLQHNKRLTLSVVASFIVVSTLYLLFLSNRKKKYFKLLANNDYLTKVYNRRSFIQHSQLQLKRSQAKDQHSLIIFDIDNFKHVNDQHGHHTGDQVLIRVAACCKEKIRNGDILSRIGGEEFAIFLPNCDSKNAHKIAESCRNHITQQIFKIANKELKISASFGICSTKKAGYIIESLMKLADHALYESKNSGRNCTTIYDENKLNNCDQAVQE